MGGWRLAGCPYLKEKGEKKKRENEILEPTCPAISGAEPCIGSNNPGP